MRIAGHPTPTLYSFGLTSFKSSRRSLQISIPASKLTPAIAARPRQVINKTEPDWIGYEADEGDCCSRGFEILGYEDCARKHQVRL